MLRSTASRGDAAAGWIVETKAWSGATANFSTDMTAGLLNFRAQSSALSPVFDLIEISEPFCSNRTISMLGRSVAIAHIRGVIPRVSRASIGAPAWSRSLTTSACPLREAKCNAVAVPNWTDPFLTGVVVGADTTPTGARRASNNRVSSTFPL